MDYFCFNTAFKKLYSACFLCQGKNVASPHHITPNCYPFFSHTLLLTFFAYHSGVRQTNFVVRMEISVLTKQISDRILPYHSQM